MTAAPERAWPRWLAVCLLALGVVVLHWPWLAAPLLAYEDGTLLFARSYAGFRVSDWFSPYAGYVPFGANLLASLACLLPTTWIPTGFVVAALAVATAAAAQILHPAWRSLAPLGQRLMLALIAGWLCTGSYAMATMLAFSQWPAIWWLLLLLLHPERRGRFGRTGEGVLITALGWSHPLSVTLLPLWLFDRRRELRSRWLWFGTAMLAHWLYVPLVRDRSPLLMIGQWFEQIVPMLGVRVGLEAFVGFGPSFWLLQQGAGYLYAAALTVWILLTLLVLRAWPRLSPPARRFVQACLFLCVTTTSMALVSRKGLDLYEVWGVRYWWPGRIAILAIAGLCAQRLWGSYTWLLFAALAVGLWFGNAIYYRHAGAAEAEAVAGFVHELAEQEQVHGGRRSIEAAFERNPFPIRIVPR